MLWKRPESVPVGKIWRKFAGKDKHGRPIGFVIRDVEEKDEQQFLDLLEANFLKDEPLSKILDIPSDPTSVASIRCNWQKLLEQRVSVICCTEDGDIAGLNVLLVATENDEGGDLEKIKGEPWKKLMKTVVRTEKMVNVFKHYGVKEYLCDSGLCVLPEYRGQNIGGKLLQARREICRAFKINAISTVFTANASQAIAQKNGYELLAEMEFSAMLEQGIDLTGCECRTAQLRGIKLNTDV